MIVGLIPLTDPDRCYFSQSEVRLGQMILEPIDSSVVLRVAGFNFCCLNPQSCSGPRFCSSSVLQPFMVLCIFTRACKWIFLGGGSRIILLVSLKRQERTWNNNTGLVFWLWVDSMFRKKMQVFPLCGPWRKSLPCLLPAPEEEWHASSLSFS